ncbi:MAG: hypothetical protein AB7E26_13490 [Chryseobacterium sp.]
MNTGFKSYNNFKNEIKQLTQLYDFTYHIYQKENKVLEIMLSETKHERKKVSYVTNENTITHSLNSLYFYTLNNYPAKLRQLVLISLITALEVYFTQVVEEISKRDLSPFKVVDERVDYRKNQILNFPSLTDIEDEILTKETRRLTSGGLEESFKYFKKRFNIDFKNLGINFRLIEEIHERRHLFVHRNGSCDSQYLAKYPESSFSVGKIIKLEHQYIINSINIILDFAKLLNEKILDLFPTSKRKLKKEIGIKTYTTGDHKIMIELLSNSASYDVNNDLLNDEIVNIKVPLLNYVIQYFIIDRKVILFLSANDEDLRNIMYTIKQNFKYKITINTEVNI